MCMNCGCGQDDDDMGNPKNITLKDIDEAVEASGISRKATLLELKKAIEKLLTKEEDGA